MSEYTTTTEWWRKAVEGAAPPKSKFTEEDGFVYIESELMPPNEIFGIDIKSISEGLSRGQAIEDAVAGRVVRLKLK